MYEVFLFFFNFQSTGELPFQTKPTNCSIDVACHDTVKEMRPPGKIINFLFNHHIKKI